jgi:hypothetical protein
MAAHVIGYTGEISENDLDNPEYAKYESGAIVGKFGIERQYNDVLTGVDGAKQVLAADAKSRPTFILDDLRQLHEPYPSTIETRDAATGDRVFCVGAAEVALSGNAVKVRVAGDRCIDLLRAGAAAIWGSGIAIYGLDVPSSLYTEG